VEGIDQNLAMVVVWYNGGSSLPKSPNGHELVAGTTKRLTTEIQTIVRLVEGWTDLRSRWSGEVVIVDSVSAMLLSRQPFLAKKEWNCRIVVLDRIVEDDLRWRTLIHEALHSVSVGNREADYRVFHGWEEGVVESLQRLYRPDILKHMGISISEAVFAEAEKEWIYEPYIAALHRLSAELPSISERTFLETLLQTPLAQRPAAMLAWGKREGNSPASFIRVFAEVSGVLRR